MLRDRSSTYSTGTSLFVSWDEVEQTIVSFVDRFISDFIPYYKSQNSPSGENRITDLLSFYFNMCAQGFAPFFFGKNPTQSTGYKESDLGVYAKDWNMVPLVPIFEFEAKKLSSSSANQEYVYGKRGGMERFKRGLHSPHLPHCGMLGYMFCNNANHWTGKINAWITTLASQSPKDGIDWRGDNELLHPIKSFGTVTKFASKNKRVTQTDIIVFHYLIDLT